MDDRPAASRRSFVGLSAMMLGAAGATAVSGLLLDTLRPTSDVMARLTRVDVSEVTPGRIVYASWNKEPIGILRRSADDLAMLDREAKAPRRAALLTFQARRNYAPAETMRPGNPYRSLRRDLFVFYASCPFDGCVVIWEDNDELICPCYGCRFDFAGHRVGGPGRRDLDIPPHGYASDQLLVIGDRPSGWS
jgi:ubiquinol-cytochrome c reductase iron-sulfur subunit